jgi:hypothetical protein
MNALKAHVKNGRLVLDVPTDLEEGSEVPLEIAPDWDEMDDEDKAALNRELDASRADREAGTPTISGEEMLAKLRARG